MDTVTDLFNRKEIKLVINIKKDDTLNTIKEKVFLSYDLDKNFISPNIMAIGDGVKYITSDIQTKNLKKIIVYNLLNEIEDYVVENISLFLTMDYGLDIIKNLYKSLTPVYTSLTEDDLMLSIKYVLLNMFNVKDYKDDIKQWVEFVKNIKKEITEKYSLISYENTTEENLKDYLFHDEEGNFLYSILNFISTYKIAEQKIDIIKIIKEYPLDKTVPVMVTSSLPDEKSILKIYKNFPKDKVKDWYINKNLETGALTVKQVKGLTFKINHKKGNFSTVIIPKDSGKLTIRSSWTKQDYFNYEGIPEILKDLSLVVKKINTVSNEEISLYDKISSSVNFIFNTKQYISLNKLKIGVKKFNNIFSVNFNNDKNNLDIEYLPDNITIVIRNSEIFDEYSGDYFKSNSVNVTGVTNKEQITTIIRLIGNLLISSDKKAKPVIIFKDFKFQTIVENDDENAKKITKKSKLNIKELKNKGVLIDSVNCQKERQPIISNDPDVLPDEKSYDLIYEGNRFICNNKSYIYPGFTNKNIVCCFSKDQRNKPVYIRNITKKQINNDKNTPYLPDPMILNSNVIKTDKILESERIGLLPDSLYNIFSKDYYRLGVYQNKANFLNVVLRALNDNKSSVKQVIDKIKNLPDSDKKRFLNKKFFNYDQIYDYLSSQFLNHKLVSDIFSFIFKINIIVFEVKEDAISCKKLLYLPYKKYIFVIKNNKYNYELIIRKASKTSIDYTFNKDNKKHCDIIKQILELYKRSCILTYVGYPTPPLNIVEILNKGITVNSQVINSFNKVVYIFTKEIGLVPVIPTKPLPELKSSNIKSNLLKAQEQYNLLLKSKIDYLKPKGQILNIKDKDKTYGIITESGLIVPTQPSQNLDNIPIIHRMFVENIDYLLKNKIPNEDERFSYILNVYFKKELYYRLKLTLSKIINYDKNKALKKSMNDIINDVSYYKTTKTKTKLTTMLKDYINSILLPEVVFTDNKNKLKIIKFKDQERNVCSELKDCSEDKFCVKNGINRCSLFIEKPLYDNFIQKITIEIISKTNKNDIMSGNVKKEFISKDKFISRANEIVLTTEKDLLKFF